MIIEGLFSEAFFMACPSGFMSYFCDLTIGL